MPKIVIDNFQNGLASSPYVADGAYAYSQGLDIWGREGIIRLSEALNKESASIVTDSIFWFKDDPINGVLYALGSTPKLYQSTDDGDTWTVVTAPSGGFSTFTGNGGLIIWKDYLFVVCNTDVDIYGPLSGTPAWTWKGWIANTVGGTALNNATWHFCKIGADDKLYIGHDNDLASIEEVAGQNFSPATATTYTYTHTALDLPEGAKIRTIEESDWGLLLGTWRGANIYDVKEATIYPWDRVSESYNSPITVFENGVLAMKNVNGIVYVVAGISGNLYQFMGSYLKLITNLFKEDLAGGNWLEVFPDAITEYQGRLLFGSAVGGGSISKGIYALKDGKINLEFINSGGNVTTMRTRALISLGNNSVVASWYDGTNYGVDMKSTSNYKYASYAGYFESLVYPVGTAKQHAGLQNLSIQLVRKLQTGEGVRISYRSSIGDSYTTLVTFDFATYGAIDSLSYPFTLPQIENIQIKVELTTGASSANTPLLRSIVLE